MLPYKVHASNKAHSDLLSKAQNLKSDPNQIAKIIYHGAVTDVQSHYGLVCSESEKKDIWNRSMKEQSELKKQYRF